MPRGVGTSFFVLKTSVSRGPSAKNATRVIKAVLSLRSCGCLGPFRCLLGPSWGHLGAMLGLSWAILGLSWRILGLSWAILWLSWAFLGAILGLSWAILGPFWGYLGANFWLLAAGCWLLAAGCWLLLAACKQGGGGVPQALSIRRPLLAGWQGVLDKLQILSNSSNSARSGGPHSAGPSQVIRRR